MLSVQVMLSFHAVYCPPVCLGKKDKNKPKERKRSSPNGAGRQSPIFTPTDESAKISQSTKVTSPGISLKKSHAPNFLLNQANTVGIIGGTSVFSTLIFLEKLVWWSSKYGGECIPFVVCSDPALNRKIIPTGSYGSLYREQSMQLNDELIVENLKRKREFLEQSGAQCIVMPCHYSHAWHSQISEDCHLPFLHVGDCVAWELKEATLKPLETGSNVRIGLLATDATLMAGIYQEKLQSQGFEVVLPDRATMEHIVIPLAEALRRKDIEGAQNLLKIAIQILLIRAVNLVILASDEMLGLLPPNEPLVRKCIDPMDALARSAVRWAKGK